MPEFLLPSHTAEDSALLRAVIDATGAYLTNVYKEVVSERLQALSRNNRNNSPAEDAEADELVRFKKVLRGLPFCTSDSAFLCLAVHGEYVTRKLEEEKVTVPPCVAVLWDEVLSENPWIPSYVSSAGEVRNRCSKVLRGYSVEVNWREADVSVALAKSDFTPDVQEALRDIAPDFPFVV